MNRRRGVVTRERLSRERVLAEALKLADDRGLDALNLRALATALSVKAMSLYNHVASKDDLLSGVLDRACIGFSVSHAAEGDWRGWVRKWMKGARAVFVRHPALFPVLLMDIPLGPNTLRMIDALVGRLEKAGFDARERTRVWSLLQTYLLGSLVHERMHFRRDSDPATIQCCPHLVRVLSCLDTCSTERFFDDGLDILLAGIKPARG